MGIQEGVAAIFSGYFSEFIHDKYLDTDLFNYKLVFDTDVFTSMTKANRLIFSKDNPNHMALLTGVDIDETTENPLKWRVENSSGDNQYLTWANAWFKEFGFGIIVDQSHCSEEILDGFKTTPIILPLVTAISRSFPNVCPGTSFCRFPGNPSRPVVPLKFSKRDKLLTFMDKINLNAIILLFEKLGAVFVMMHQYRGTILVTFN